jgi:drug/metabolite transporter (DMT)-like permease
MIFVFRISTRQHKVNQMNNFYKGAVLSLLSALGFGLLPIFALFAYQGNISVTTLLLIRFSLTAVLLFIYVFIKFKRISLTKKDWLALLILGGICYTLQSRLYFTSVKYISSSLAVLLLYTYPIIVTALSFFLDKEKITMKMGVSLSISFAGLIMILGTSIGKVNGLGILMALGASFIYSTYIILGNRILKRMPPLVASAFIALFSAIGILILGSFTDGISFRFETTVWFPIVGLVLFSTVLAMLFFFRGMELLGPAKASIISMIEPVFTAIFSTILLSDHLTIFQLIGGAIVLTGSIFVIWSREQNKVYQI